MPYDLSVQICECPSHVCQSLKLLLNVCFHVNLANSDHVKKVFTGQVATYIHSYTTYIHINMHIYIYELALPLNVYAL